MVLTYLHFRILEFPLRFRFTLAALAFWNHGTRLPLLQQLMATLMHRTYTTLLRAGDIWLAMSAFASNRSGNKKHVKLNAPSWRNPLKLHFSTLFPLSNYLQMGERHHALDSIRILSYIQYIWITTALHVDNVDTDMSNNTDSITFKDSKIGEPNGTNQINVPMVQIGEPIGEATKSIVHICPYRSFPSPSSLNAQVLGPPGLYTIDMGMGQNLGTFCSPQNSWDLWMWITH